MAKERAIFTLNYFPDLSSPGGPHSCAKSAGWHWGRSEGTCEYPQLASMQVVHTPGHRVTSQRHLHEAAACPSQWYHQEGQSCSATPSPSAWSCYSQLKTAQT